MAYDRSKAMSPQLEPGDNTKYLTHALKSWDLPKICMNDPEAVRERSIMYLQSCADDDMKPTITGYANYLGISRQELHNIANGTRGNGSAIEIIRQVKGIIEEQMETYMMNGKINPVSGIFLLKNNFQNYVDKQELEVKASPIEEADKERIAQNYADYLPALDDNQE